MDAVLPRKILISPMVVLSFHGCTGLVDPGSADAAAPVCGPGLASTSPSCTTSWTHPFARGGGGGRLRLMVWVCGCVFVLIAPFFCPMRYLLLFVCRPGLAEPFLSRFSLWFLLLARGGGMSRDTNAQTTHGRTQRIRLHARLDVL